MAAMAAELRPAVRRPAVSQPNAAATPGRWSRWLRYGLPFVMIGLVIAVVGAIAVHIHESNRRGALALSDDLLDAVARRIMAEVEAFLAPPEQFLAAIQALAGAGGVFAGGTATEAFALGVLPRLPQVAGYSYGDRDGNFLFIVRNEAGGYDTKLVDRREGAPRTTWTRRDRAGAVIERAADPTDTFDPRGRPWYVGAERAGAGHWSDAYLFFTLRQPGVTYSLPHRAADGTVVAVSGVDIELSALSTFLTQIEVGRTGRALIVDAAGRVVAFPAAGWVPPGRLDAPPQLDSLGDPMLTRAYNRLRVAGHGRAAIEVDGKRIVVAAQPIKALTGRDWSLLIAVPESDFVGYVATGAGTAVALSAIIVAILIGLAVLLVWRNALVDRRLRAARLRQEALESRASALAELAASTDIVDRATLAGVRAATETAATTCRAQRVGIWYTTPDGRTLVCEDCYDRPARAHTSGMELHRDELPRLFAALAAEGAIETVAAARDSRTSELSSTYLEPLGIQSAHIAPVRSGGRLLGMLLVENPRRGDRATGLTAFCSAMANLLAVRFRPQAGVAGPVAPPEDPRLIARRKLEQALGVRKAALDHTLLQHFATAANLAAGYVELAAVAVVKLPDWLWTAQRAEGNGHAEGRARMDALAEAVADSLRNSGVSYAGMFDDLVILAAYEAGHDAATNARVAAAAAIALRDRLAGLTAGWGAGSEFRMALDIGPVMTSSGKTHAAAAGLWGGAVSVAKILAASGGRRTITVSEAAYRLLSPDFLFRQRGTYFLPETGTMRTFVLVEAL
jgi:adenylate cyclase